MINLNKTPNRLINSNSPYLLQHAYNPVNWYPWEDEAFSKASKEDKLVIISIGYSACHWCHVMEKESFEKEEVAKIMNDNFVSIKVDREERPDIDQVYMNAIQILTGNGGWPLNIISLPNGKPIYAITYLPKSNWMDMLIQISNLYKNDKEKTITYAENLTKGIKSIDENSFKINKNSSSSFIVDNENLLIDFVNNWKKSMDFKEGGPLRTPKFPLPNDFIFLLNYSILFKDYEIEKYVYLTLDKISMGGIYDQIGGGFARYSVDDIWKVPHFEKMLYDNAQLVNLYSTAYKKCKFIQYKEIVYQTIEFIEKELTRKDGLFFSALDADSEGQEGKYYIWKKEEIKNILANDFDIFSKYYNINDLGYWEDENYILLRKENDEDFCQKNNLNINEFKIKKLKIINSLKNIRELRIKPSLDDKCIISWNALMISGLFNAYDTFGEEKFKNIAIKAINNLVNKNIDKENKIFHISKNDQYYINGFLDDYSFLIEALINAYKSTFNENYLKIANNLLDYTIENFYDKQKGMFFYKSKKDKQLISNTIDYIDNVIPSSNSSLAKNLHYFYLLVNKKEYNEIYTKMLDLVSENFKIMNSSISNWADLLLKTTKKHYEIVIIGDEYQKILKELNKYFLPNIYIYGSKNENTLFKYKFEYKYKENDTYIYICENNKCLSPIKNVNECINILNY